LIRITLAFLLLLAAFWRGWTDWERTIGEGYAYRLTSIGGTWEQASPESHAATVAAWRAADIPYLWDPIGATLLALPLALVLVVLAALLWFTRRRRR
jgi:hypothetical protein